MIYGLARLARQFQRQARGNVATVVAILAVPLVGFAGGAVDFVRFTSYNAELQAANDSAILAASRLMGSTEEVQRATAFDYLDRNISQRVTNARILSKDYQGVDNCTASNPAFAGAPTTCLDLVAELDTYFLKLFGLNKFDIEISSQATVETKPMEITFAFDATGSMGFGNRWDDAKDALEGMLDVLKASAESEGEDAFRAAFVPYSDRITVPPSLYSVIDPSITLDYTGNSKWRFKGCVEPREEDIDGDPWTLTDKTPAELPFRPSQRGQYGPIYGNVDPVKDQPGRPPVCLGAQLVPLTNDVEDIRDALDDLTRSGTGRFDIGAAWAWRVMSPGWRTVFGDAEWPRDYKDNRGRENTKIAVIITDGNTTAYEYEIWQSGDARKPWGYNKGTPRGFQHFADVCNRMTDAGIHVHMIMVAKADTHSYNPDFLTYARDCASRSDYFHPVDDADDLILAFQRIGQQASKLRLTR